MSRRPLSDVSARPIGIILDPGWLLPAVLVFAFISAFYLPAHPGSRDGRELIAAVAASYVVGLSVVLPRLLRGLLLRRAGWSGPIVVLGHGEHALEREELRPSWRVAALVAGFLASSTLALLAALVLSGAAVGTYPHAVGTVALATNASLALGALIPVPGFGGWAILLAVADARGEGHDRRISWTGRAASRAGVAIAGALILLGVVSGDPMPVALGPLVGGFVWLQTGLARKVDAADRFFAQHAAVQLTRGLTAVRRADERVSDLDLRARGEPALVVSDDGALLGAIGPRQIRAALRDAGPLQCGDVAIPVRRFSIVAGSASASELLGQLSQHGFAVVRDDDRFLVAEVDDVRRQIRAWSAAEVRDDRWRSESRTGNGGQ